MKKILSVLFFSFFGFSAFSQGLSVGIKAGLNIADQKYTSGLILDTKALLGFHAGAYATVMLNKNIGIQPEVLYSTQGAKLEFLGSASHKFNYINVPVLFRYNVNKLLSFHAGPQIGFLASAKLKNGDNSQDIKSSYKGADFSLAVGGIVDLPMKLSLTARYAFGLTNLYTYDSPKIKSCNIQISVGYKLFGK
jgi:hypothetical protein